MTQYEVIAGQLSRSIKTEEGQTRLAIHKRGTVINFDRDSEEADRFLQLGAIKPLTAETAAANGVELEEEPEDDNGDGEVDDIERMTVDQLRGALTEAGLPVSGNKGELQERLREHQAADAGDQGAS